MVNPSSPTPNLHTLLQFVSDLTRFRLAQWFGQTDAAAPAVPSFTSDGHPLTLFVQQRRPTVDEIVLLAVGLAPHIEPYLFEEVMQAYLPGGGDFPPIGGVKGTNFRGFLPTGETAMFLLAGRDLDRRVQVMRMFGAQHYFVKENVLYLEEMKPGEPFSSGKLILDPEWVQLFTLGYITMPRLSTSFPAQRIENDLLWEDLVLGSQTMGQLKEIETWIKYNDTFLFDWKMDRMVKPGYRALFYGPPGTGKTMAAGLLGKYTGREVFRIDLSNMVSKFIGETEKNLATLFDKAENKKWILFFDEADALFGKRTNVRDAHDKYANQEVSYLLQRIEEFAGLSILASNFKSNLDDAFTRRFQSIVYFPMPQPTERLELWKRIIPDAVQLDPQVDLDAISRKYELTGSNILNIVQYACLQALSTNSNVITREILYTGISREFAKENKIIS